MICAAELAGRTLVLDPYALFVLHLLKSEPGKPDPFSGVIPVRVWFPDGHLPNRTGPFKYVSEQASALAVSINGILAEPSRYALNFRSWMGDRHPEILARSDVAIWSYWSGYERSARVSALRDRLASAGIEWFRAHASGHILAEDSRRLVERLNPRTLIPIHTEHADRFPDYFPGRSVTRLRDGEAFTL